MINLKERMVPDRRIEPTTSWLQVGHKSNWATRPNPDWDIRCLYVINTETKKKKQKQDVRQKGYHTTTQLFHHNNWLFSKNTVKFLSLTKHYLWYVRSSDHNLKTYCIYYYYFSLFFFFFFRSLKWQKMMHVVRLSFLESKPNKSVNMVISEVLVYIKIT